MTIFTTVITVLLIIAAAYGYARYVEPQIISANHQEIESDQVTNSLEGLKIVQFNDTHVGFSYGLDNIRKAVSEINDANADIVVFAGDLFDNYKKSSDLGTELSVVLSGIKARLGKFAVLGNHDYGANSVQHVTQVLEAAGFTVLVNETYRIPQLNLSITGIDDMLIGYGDASAVNGLSSSDFNLVICHEPDVFDMCYNSNIDLMLSGHTHGGQVKIPFMGAILLPQLGRVYDEGLYESDNARRSQLYVNRGLGTTKMPMRFASVPEITIFELKK